MKKYRKKPVIIEAMELEFSETTQTEIINWINNNGCQAKKALDGGIIIKTSEGNMLSNTGDYIIKGVRGEFYACKPDIFKETYEEVVE